jgi:hypothetical protein
MVLEIEIHLLDLSFEVGHAFLDIHRPGSHLPADDDDDSIVAGDQRRGKRCTARALRESGAIEGPRCQNLTADGRRTMLVRSGASMRPRVVSLSDLAGRTGRGVRVAVVDSGIHAAHPHVGSVAGGIGFDDRGQPTGDMVDRLGHGTAVAAAIHEKAPDAELLAVKVFDRSLEATAAALSAAIRWSAEAGATLINLSLGTTNEAHAGELSRAVADARRLGSQVVAAAPDADHRWLPGALTDVIAVELDWLAARHSCVIGPSGPGVLRIRASGYPRPIPGVPPERNLRGPSFAVANASGLLALLIEGSPPPSLEELRASLEMPPRV